MPASTQPAQQDRTDAQNQQYAVYEPKEGRICHTDGGAAIADNRNDAASLMSTVADQLGLTTEELEIVRLTITPIDTQPTETGDDETRDAEPERTTGSIVVKRGPHRQNAKLVEYRQAEDGAWAVKTPADDEFWIFMRSGTERDVHQRIRAKWDATYSSPDAFTDQSCPTGDL